MAKNGELINFMPQLALDAGFGGAGVHVPRFGGVPLYSRVQNADEGASSAGPGVAMALDPGGSRHLSDQSL